MIGDNTCFVCHSCFTASTRSSRHHLDHWSIHPDYRWYSLGYSWNCHVHTELRSAVDEDDHLCIRDWLWRATGNLVRPTSGAIRPPIIYWYWWHCGHSVGDRWEEPGKQPKLSSACVAESRTDYTNQLPRLESSSCSWYTGQCMYPNKLFSSSFLGPSLTSNL